MIDIFRITPAQVKRWIAALLMAIVMALPAFANTGLDLKTYTTANQCTGNGITVNFAIINNTGAAVSGPFTIAVWINDVGTPNINSPQLQGNYTSAYPSTAGWNQAGSAGNFQVTAFSCAAQGATQMITEDFTPQNPLAAGGWLYGTFQIYLNGWISPMDAGCDDYTHPVAAAYTDYNHICLYRGGALEVEQTAPGVN